MAVADTSARRAAFRELHESGCFVIPNPWDVGTARYLRHLGFKALATTSSGFAFSRGLPDADWAVPLDDALAHIAEIVAATDLPVNADFESGYAHEPEAVAENVAALRRDRRRRALDRGRHRRSGQAPLRSRSRSSASGRRARRSTRPARTCC